MTQQNLLRNRRKLDVRFKLLRIGSSKHPHRKAPSLSSEDPYSLLHPSPIGEIFRKPDVIEQLINSMEEDMHNSKSQGRGYEGQGFSVHSRSNGLASLKKQNSNHSSVGKLDQLVYKTGADIIQNYIRRDKLMERLLGLSHAEFEKSESKKSKQAERKTVLKLGLTRSKTENKVTTTWRPGNTLLMKHHELNISRETQKTRNSPQMNRKSSMSPKKEAKKQQRQVEISLKKINKRSNLPLAEIAERKYIISKIVNSGMPGKRIY